MQQKTRAAPTLALLLLLACSAPVPLVPTATVARVAPTPTPRPEAALAVVVVRVDEAPIPPAEPTLMGLPLGRPTPTPAATPETAWKYVTFTFAVENRSDAVRLVGLGGGDPASTNLAGALLVGRDGTRYKPFRSYSSFGLRTATARSLNNYPVLLRLPPGFRAAAESFGMLSTTAPTRNSLTFKVPAGVTDYGTLTIPPMTNFGAKNADDEVARRIRSAVGSFQNLDLGGLTAGAQQVAFPTAAPPPQLQTVGTPVAVPGKLTVTLVGASTSAPSDFQARNRGWKQVSMSLRYRNDDQQQAHGFTVSAWLFGDDGVVYTGDVPAIGDFGRATSPPEANVMGLWDGRPAGADTIAAGQQQEPRQAVFLVPRELQNGILVLGGDVEAFYALDGLGVPP
jgi:hypothetical protein